MEHTLIFTFSTGEGIGLDNVQSESRFDFLSFFTQEEENESVPDSFFINNQSSPYSNINLNCSYLDMDKLNELSSEKFTVLSLNIQSLPSKFSEFTDLLSQFPQIKPQMLYVFRKPGKSLITLSSHLLTITH